MVFHPITHSEIDLNHVSATCLRYNSKGDLFALGLFDGDVYVYDTITNTLARTFTSPEHMGHTKGVTCVEYD